MSAADKSLSTCGIDFGTTNSTIAIVKDNHSLPLNIDPDSTTPHILKSLIYANAQKDIKIGQSAIDRYRYDLEHIPAKARKSNLLAATSKPLVLPAAVVLARQYLSPK